MPSPFLFEVPLWYAQMVKTIGLDKGWTQRGKRMSRPVP